MKRVGRREILLSPGKYLVPGAFMITNRGDDQYKVLITDMEDSKAPNEEEKESESVSETPAQNIGTICPHCMGEGCSKCPPVDTAQNIPVKGRTVGSFNPKAGLTRLEDIPEVDLGEE